jgi:hypothetical protein
MVSSALSGSFAAVWAAITAIQFYYSLNLHLQPGAGTSTTTTTASTASIANFQQIFLTLVAMGTLYAAAALVYRSVRRAEAGGAAGGGDRRPADLVAFVSAAAGVLEFFLFVDNVGAAGLAAARVLPAASIATFFLGIVLMILLHIRAGGEGDGGGAVAGGGAVEVLVWVVTKMAFAAAAGLVALMAIALCAN